MKLLNFTKQIAALAVVAAVFTSCDKADKVDPIGDRGQTLIKVLEAGTPTLKTFAIDFVNTPTSLVGADVRRDVPSNAELMKPATVTLVDDTMAVNAAGLLHMDPAWYTIEGATKTGGVAGTNQGGVYTVTFAPGEFAKPIRVIIPDATVLDPSEQYGLAFRLVSTDHGNLSVNNTLVMVIGAKNKYDGVYDLRGIHNRPTYQFFYQAEMEMITTGASSVIFYFVDAGSVGHPIAIDANNTLSWYGATVAPEVNFNASNDLAVDIYNTNPAGPPINKADGQNYPGAPVPGNPTISRYDAATKTMYLYWKYNNNPDRAFFDTLVYTGPR